jgi:hypothetical protein
MLIKPVKDFTGVFVIGTVNRFFAVSTVEDQHFEPQERRWRRKRRMSGW